MGMFQDIDYSQIVLQDEKAIANGIATLDSNTKIPKAQINGVLSASDVGAIATETDPTVPNYTKGLTSANTLLTELKTVDGTGSGLDADLVRGINPSSFLTTETDPTVSSYTKTLTSANVLLTELKTVDGSGSGLDADLVRGVNPNTFLTSETDPTVASFTKGLTTNNSILTALNAASGTISANLLPSYVDDFLTFASLAAFPVTGETGKIYLAENTNLSYRWTGSSYVDISSVGTADQAIKLTTPRTISTTGDATYSVSFDGSANASGTITLATVNSDVGDFGSASSIPAITVNAKGQITRVTTNSIGNELIAIQALDDTTVGFLRKTGNGTYSIDVSNYLTSNQSITVTGDVTGSGTTAISLTLANSGVVAGTYNALSTQVRPFTVDTKGRITGVGTPINITPSWTSITNKPSPITYLENNHTPPNWSYWLFGNFYGQYWELISASQAAGNNTVALRNATGGLVGTTLSATSTTPSTSPTSGANVVAGGQGIQGNQHVGGFSSLGGTSGGHPAIKIKVIEGTTAATEGGTSIIAHGVTSSKIVSVSVLVSHMDNQYLPNSYAIVSGYHFSFAVANTDIYIQNIAANSINILSKPVIITIIYKE